MKSNVKQSRVPFEVRLEAGNFSLAEAAELIGLSRTSIWKLTTTGQLRCRKVGRRVFVPGVELRRFLAGDGAEV